MSNWTYPIYRANDTQLRLQIMEALEDLNDRLALYYLEGFPLVKKILESGESLTIPVNYQLITYRSFTVEGTLTNNGELVILDEVEAGP